MALEQPSLDQKIAYFDRLKALQDDADDFDALEEQDRLLRARFFPTRTMPPRPQAYEGKAARKNKSPRKQIEKIERPGLSKETTIKATPQNLMRNRLTSLLDQDGTIIPDSARLKKSVTSLERSETIDSPSTGPKKRKRDSINLRPEQEQIFKGLLFYYIPNNDIAPLEKTAH